MATNNATNTSNPITVPQGGTGVSTITGLLIGSGTSNITAAAYIATTTTTATLTFGGGSTGLTTSDNTINYTRVGSVVFFNLYLQLTAKGSSTGTALISGLPYACDNVTALVMSSNGITSTGQLTGVIVAGTGTFNIANTVFATGVQTNLTDTSFSNSSFLQISGSYITTQAP